MAGIVTAVAGTCGHKQLTVDLDGVTAALLMHESEAAEALTDEDQSLLLRLAIRRLRNAHGVTLAQMLNRVVQGDEATNVKQYDFLAPGSAITKTNIGTAYVDIPVGANGCRVLVDCTGCVEYRVILTANLVATGPFKARIIRDADTPADDGAVLGMNGYVGGTDFVKTTFNGTPSSGSHAWTDTTTVRPAIFPVISALDLDFPAVGNVTTDDTVQGVTGTFAAPATTDVKSGVQYGAGGTEFTGSYSAGGGLLTHPGMAGGMRG